MDTEVPSKPYSVYQGKLDNRTLFLLGYGGSTTQITDSLVWIMIERNFLSTKGIVTPKNYIFLFCRIIEKKNFMWDLECIAVGTTLTKANF